MAKVIMAKAFSKDGLDYYCPVDADDAKELGGREMIAFELLGKRAMRTLAQHKSIRLYCRWLCDAFNEAGLDMAAVFKVISKTGKIPWSPESVLERLWRPTQKHTFGTDSTTKLDTTEVSVVYEALNVVTSGELGVGINFPDKYMKLYEEEDKASKA